MTPPAPGLSATLLVLSPGEEVAKRIESHLRNAGHPMRVAWVTDLEDMEDALRRAATDLVLVYEGNPKIEPRDALTLAHRINPDLPVLLLAAKPFSMGDTVAALRLGMRGLVIDGDGLPLEHLETIVVRELRTYFHLKELLSTRARLADYEERHEKLMASTGDAVLRVQEGVVTDANAAFANLVGQKDAGAIGGTPLMDLVARDSQAAVKAYLKQVAQNKAPSTSELEVAFATAAGPAVKVQAKLSLGGTDTERVVEMLIHPVAAPTPVAVAPAPAAAAPAPATAPVPAPPPAKPAPPAAPGLGGGRLELFQILNQAIAANVGMHRALVMIMVDNFASVEQRLGYHESEMALTQLAETVARRFSPREPLFRFSTALMAAIVSRPSTAEFATLGETLKTDIAGRVFKTDNYEAQLTVTVICYPLSSSDKAVDVVDAAVRDARKLSREGGNRMAVLGAAAQAAATAADEQRKADSIKRAIAENRMKLAYQSIASLEGGDHHHFDVLARMLDEKGQEVPAREFIPTAEKFGLIVAVDRWVLARAVTVLAKRVNATDASSLFVRLSENSVREGDALYKWLAEILKQRPLSKGGLVVSIQESIVESHIGKVKALSQALRGLGAEMAMDYFGVGTQSAKMLEHMDPQYVRFHYSFTRDFNDAKTQDKLADLMRVAKARKVKTIVGQVEDANAMARLWQMGVNYIQGFHVQAPEAVLLASDVR